MSLIEFFSTLGIFSITLGQSIMLLVGLLLLYLAINKKFEPFIAFTYRFWSTVN
jgi:oxaloacetate decarboxylase beta subunit